MRLQIGAGRRPIPGFLNYDVDDSHRMVDYAEADNIPCEDNAIDLIFSNAFFEHIPPHQYPHLFAEWHRILKSDGSMVHLGIPWFDYLVELYFDGKISRSMLKNWVLGEVDNDSGAEDFHKNLFDPIELKAIFKEFNFTPVQVFNYCYPGETLPVNLGVVYGDVTIESIPEIRAYIDLDLL